MKGVQTKSLATKMKAEPLAGMLGYGGERWLSLHLSTQHAGLTKHTPLSGSLRSPSGSMWEPTKSLAAMFIHVHVCESKAKFLRNETNY